MTDYSFKTVNKLTVKLSRY